LHEFYKLYPREVSFAIFLVTFALAVVVELPGS